MQKKHSRGRKNQKIEKHITNMQGSIMLKIKRDLRNIVTILRTNFRSTTKSTTGNDSRQRMYEGAVSSYNYKLKHEVHYVRK